MVVTSRLATSETEVIHARTASLSTWTVQAPQRAWPQPNLVPVKPISSRRNQSSGRSGSPSQLCSWPLIFNLIMIVPPLFLSYLGPMRRKPEHASISFASTTRLLTRLNRVRKADRPHRTTCSVVCSCVRLLLLFSSWLLCRRTFIAKAAILSEIDVELTSQTVVFACFFVAGRLAGALQFSIQQSLRVCGSGEKKCFARRLRSELPDQAALAFATWVSIAYTTRAEHSNADLSFRRVRKRP